MLPPVPPVAVNVPPFTVTAPLIAAPPALAVAFICSVPTLPPVPPVAVSVPLFSTSTPLPATVEFVFPLVPLITIAPSPLTLRVAPSFNVIPAFAVNVAPFVRIRFTVPVTVI